MKKLEDVQRATRMISALRRLDYCSRLEQLKLSSTAYRHDRGDIIETYEYCHGVYKLRAKLLQLSASTRTCGDCWKLQLQTSSTKARHDYFTNHMVHLWNSLPSYVVTADSGIISRTDSINIGWRRGTELMISTECRSATVFILYVEKDVQIQFGLPDRKTDSGGVGSFKPKLFW